MKIYDLVKQVLTDVPECRNSDKKLIWAIWCKKGLVQVNQQNILISKINYMDFMNTPSTETIRRCRQKVQELHPELAPTSSSVSSKRRKKQETKGTFIYREE